jgi:hypothetical protein
MHQASPSPIPLEVDDPVEVQPPTVTIKRRLVLDVEAAAPLIAEAPPGTRSATLERLLEFGAQAEGMYRTNLAAQLLERRVAALGDNLQVQLATTLKAGGHSVEERVTRLLHQHEKDLLAWATRYLDPSNEDAIPSVTARKLRQVSEAAIAEVRQLLADGDDGILAKWADSITRQVKESEANVVAQLVHKQAVATLGVHKGRSYEEAVSAKLAQLGLATGCTVDRCSDRLGLKRTRHGDHLITLDPATTGGETLRIVTEEKARSDGQRFGFEAVEKECEHARANRGAAAAVFIAETRDSLPDGVSFGQIGHADYFVHFDPATGDDVGLVAAIYLARSGALQGLRNGGAEPVDRTAAKRLVDEIRERIERRSRIERFHSTAVKAIHNAGKALDEDTEAVLMCLARIDAMLSL